MVQAVRAFVLALLVALPLLAGCVSDVERHRLEVGWEPTVTMADGPSLELAAWPAQLVVEGVVEVASSERVELTGVEAAYTLNGTEHELTPVRLVVDGEGISPDQALENETLLGDGDRLSVSFLPAPGEELLQPAGYTVNLTMELRWRFRQGDLFDAGRLEADGNVTLERTRGLGIGAVQAQDGQVTQVAFKATGLGALNGTQRADVFAVRTTGQERLGPVEMTFSPGQAVVLGEPASGAGLPDGDGYVLYRFGEATGSHVAVLEIGEVEQATPLPGLLLVLAALGGAAVLGAKRRR